MKISVKNNLGNTLELNTLEFPVVAVDGLTPSKATINTSIIATTDGSTFSNSRVESRNIVLTIVPEGEPEKLRQKLYRFFKVKYPITLYIKTKYRDVFIDGYTEAVEGGLFEEKQSFQISIICPMPFFSDVNTVSIVQQSVVSAFEFPFSIDENGVEFGEIKSAETVNVQNDGEEMTGLTIDLYAKDTVLEPTLFNQSTGEKFTVQVELKENDKIEIDTRKGQKSIYVIKKDGTKENVLNRVMKGSKWFQLETGENIFSCSCAYGIENLNIVYSFNPLYEGV